MIKDIRLVINNSILADPIIIAAVGLAERLAADLTIESGATKLSQVRYAPIGWNDTPVAHRAIHDLIAVMKPITKGAVGGIGRDDSETFAITDSAREVVLHLITLGFDAEAHVLLDNRQSQAEALERFALRHRVELPAIGAFGHSRLREVVFGGETRSLIEQPGLSVLLSS
jgi:nucleotide-binding universal stress UspA family protein